MAATIDAELRRAVAAAAAGGDASRLSALLDGCGGGDALDLVEALSEHALQDGVPCELTPLMAAAAGAHAPTMRVLMQRGASATAGDGRGRTAAHEAAVADDPAAACLALLAQAVTEREPEAEPAVPAQAVPRIGPATIHLLIAKAKGGVQPLHAAAEAGRAGNVQFLIGALGGSDNGSEGAAALVAAVKGGWTAAHFAATNGHAQCLSLLCEQDALPVCAARACFLNHTGRLLSVSAYPNTRINLTRAHGVCAAAGAEKRLR